MEQILPTSSGTSTVQTTWWGIGSGGGHFSSGGSELQEWTHLKCMRVCMMRRKINKPMHRGKVEQGGNAKEVDSPRVHDRVGLWPYFSRSDDYTSIKSWGDGWPINWLNEVIVVIQLSRPNENGKGHWPWLWDWPWTLLKHALPTKMTRNGIYTNKPWPKCHDGLQHASLPVTNNHCQYCLFQYTDDFDDNQRQANLKMERNWANVHQCLVCNVNLCPIRKIEFHGVRIVQVGKSLRKIGISTN